jgi:hypothetical protein
VAGAAGWHARRDDSKEKGARDIRPAATFVNDLVPRKPTMRLDPRRPKSSPTKVQERRDTGKRQISRPISLANCTIGFDIVPRQPYITL